MVVDRLMAAPAPGWKSHTCDLVVFPELGLTTFFPRWFFEARATWTPSWRDRDAFGRHQSTIPEAAQAGVGFSGGSPSLARWPSLQLPDPRRDPRQRRDRPLPEDSSSRPREEYERRGGPSTSASGATSTRGLDSSAVWDAVGGTVGMAICNDRRWPGHTGAGAPSVSSSSSATTHRSTTQTIEPDTLAVFHKNALVMQSRGRTRNGSWVVGVAKAGIEEGVDRLAGSCVVAPSGQIVAQASTNGDELIARSRLTATIKGCANYKTPCST